MSGMRKSSRLRSKKNEKTSYKEKEEGKLKFDEENKIIYMWDEDSKIIDRYHLRKLRNSLQDIEEDVIFYGTLILIDLNSSKIKNVSTGDGIIIASDNNNDDEFYIATIDAFFKTNDDEKHASVTWYFMPFEIPKSKRPAHYQKNEVFLCSVKSEKLINAETIIDRCQINHTPLSEEESSSRSYFCEKSFDGKKFQNIEHLKSKASASALIRKNRSDVKNDPLARSPPKEDTSCSMIPKKKRRTSSESDPDVNSKRFDESDTSSDDTIHVDESSGDESTDVYIGDESTDVYTDDEQNCSDVEEDDDEVTKKKWERKSVNVKNKKSQLSEKISMEKIKMFPLRIDNHCSNDVVFKELVIKVKRLDLKRQKKENKPGAIRSSSRLSKKKIVIPKKKRRTSSESDPDVNSKRFDESDTSSDDTIHVDESSGDESTDVYTDDEQMIPKKKRRTSSESDPDVNSKRFDESDTSSDDTIHVDESSDDESTDVYTDDESTDMYTDDESTDVYTDDESTDVYTDDESTDVYTDDEQSKKSSETPKTRSNNVITSRPTRTRRDSSKKVVRSTKKDRSAYIPRRKTPLRACRW